MSDNPSSNTTRYIDCIDQIEPIIFNVTIYHSMQPHSKVNQYIHNPDSDSDIFIIPLDETDNPSDESRTGFAPRSARESELYRSYRDIYDDIDEAYDVSDLYNVYDIPRNYPTFEEYKQQQIEQQVEQMSDNTDEYYATTQATYKQQYEQQIKQHLAQSTATTAIRTINEPEMFKEITKSMAILIGRVHSISLRGSVYHSHHTHRNTGLEWLANSVRDIMQNQSTQSWINSEPVTDHFVDIMYYAIQEDDTSRNTPNSQIALPKQISQWINHDQYLQICYTLNTHRETLYETMLGDLYKGTGIAKMTKYVLYGWLAHDSYMRSLFNTVVFDPTMLNRVEY